MKENIIEKELRALTWFIRRRRRRKQTGRREYLKHRETTRAIILARVDYFNQDNGFKFGRISIKNQKTCWGSCSRKGNLNFNYKLILLPERLRDYVIVHELCHLQELNHSKKFWNLVAVFFPDYLVLKKELAVCARKLAGQKIHPTGLV